MQLARRLNDLWDEITDITGLKLLPDPLTHPLPGDAAVSIRLPGYRQTDSFSCGYVAGLMALRALYPRRSAERFRALVAPNRVTGTSNARLIHALRASGVSVGERRSLTHADLAEVLSSGAPVITTIATGVRDTWHWVTLYGIGRRPNRVFMAGSGTPGLSRIRREHELPWGEFASLWRPRGFGLVCRRR